jgi:hypothetical protein
MPVATAFRVLLPNRPGAIAGLARNLAEVGVNIETGAAVANGREAYFEFQVSDPGSAVRVLKEQGTPFQQVQVLLAWIPNRPGALGRALGPLEEAGINIDSLYMVAREEDRTLMAIGCGDVERADQLISSGPSTSSHSGR